MAYVEENTGKRPSNVDVNIVPFIDLMSVLIIFLLISAVWTQVSMIQIGSSVYGKKTAEDSAPPPPRAEIPFLVNISENGYSILVGRQKIKLSKLNGSYDLDRLGEELVKIKELYPDKTDAVLSMDEELEYEQLIVGMDALLASGFPEIAISTQEVQ